MLGPQCPSNDPWSAYAALLVLTYIDIPATMSPKHGCCASRTNRALERGQVGISAGPASRAVLAWVWGARSSAKPFHSNGVTRFVG